MKILIIGPSWVGDMVMAQSLFSLIKQQNPHASIDVLAPAWSRALLERMPEVATPLASPFKHRELSIQERYRQGLSLRKHDYQQVIVLPNSIKSALVPFFAKIPLRTGWRGEFRYGLLNDVRILDKERYPLMVQRFMALALPKDAAPITILPTLQLNACPENARKTQHKLGLDTEKPIIVFCPGAEYGPAKCWPAPHFADLAKNKVKEGYEVWLIGSPNDKKTADAIQHHSGGVCVDITGRTDLSEAIDLISLAKVVVSNDSGLMHVAAALHKPLVALYRSHLLNLLRRSQKNIK